MNESTARETVCNLCNSAQYKIIGKPRIDRSFPRAEINDYRIVKCMECGFYYVNPRIDLTEAEWTSLYEKDYFGESMKTPWQISLNHRENEQRLKQITTALNIEKGPFLDMGCGEGYMLKHAADHGFTPQGCDIACNLHPDFADRFPFFKGNILDAAYPDNFFTIIYMDSVMEHVTDPTAVLKELQRILKPGGLLLMIVPNEDSLMNTLTKWGYFLSLNGKKYGKIKPFVTPYHINGFTKKALQSMFLRNHFELVRLKSFGGNYTFWKASKAFSKSWLVNLMLYPAGLLSIILGNQIQLTTLARKPQ